MSASNNQRAKVVNYVYKRLAATNLGKNIRIERDSLSHMYEVNRYSLNIYVNNTKDINHLKSLSSRFEKMIVEGLSLEKRHGYFKTKEDISVHFSVNESMVSYHDSYIRVFIF